MSKLEMNELYESFNLTDDIQKAILSELVFSVITGNSTITNYSNDLRELVRKKLFGDLYDTRLEKVLGIAGYWANDLAEVFSEDVGLSGGMQAVFNKLFDLLDNKEIVDGICYHK